VTNKIKKIPFHDFGGQGPTLHFAYANGYPYKAYKQFITPFLKNYRVIASEYRVMWSDESPKSVNSWMVYADDLIQFMDENNLKNIIGMGHSMGGTISALAAAKRPDLFSKLIVIDPVILSKQAMGYFRFLPVFVRRKLLPMAKVALKRKDSWQSKAEVFNHWRTKKVFKRFSDESLNDLVNAATIKTEKGNLTLAFSKEWEAQVYVSLNPFFSMIKKLELPMLVVKPAQSVLSDQVWSDWKKAQPTNQFLEIKDAGHLVPLEYPLDLANQILERL